MKRMFLLIIAMIGLSLIAKAQFEDFDMPRLIKETHTAYNFDSVLSFAPSTLKGRFTITPDDNGILNFDTVLAIRFQTALEAEYFSKAAKGGLNAAVLIPNKGIWQGTIGISTESPVDSLRSNMLFCIASNTKTFIAVLIMKLVEEGKVALDDSIYRFLPKYQNIDSALTIRQLLSMRSGLWDFGNDSPTGFINALFNDPLYRWKPEEILTRFVGPAKFLPGQKYGYCNTNLVLAGMIIEKISGKPIETVLRERLLTPLALQKTFFPMTDSLAGDVSHGWYYGYFPTWKDLSDVPIDSRVSSVWTAGAIYSTTENMARWLKKLYHNEILNPSSMAEMVKQYDSVETYGLCTWRETFYDMILQGHTGGFFGSLSTAFYDTISGIAFVTHRNANGQGPTPYLSLWGLCHTYLRTTHPFLSVNTQIMDLKANNGKTYWDTTFVVKNIGETIDSVIVTVVPSVSEPESTYSIIPSIFNIQPNDSQSVTFRINTNKWLRQKAHNGKIVFESKLGYAKMFERSFQIIYTLDVEKELILPTAYLLNQNYPNPFNPSTTIRYALPSSAQVKLSVYDLLGREIATLVNEEQSAGWKEVQWNASNVSSGIYFYRLKAGQFQETKRMILMK